MFQSNTTNKNYVQAMISRETSNRRLVRWWLYVICFLVFLMVMVGGATRLTDSGLSITEWKPIHGIIPPLSDADWQEELEKYRQIPEYQQINKGMSMAEFQFIYWWEWGHRFLGRIIGFAFAIPLHSSLKAASKQHQSNLTEVSKQLEYSCTAASKPLQSNFATD